MGDGPPPGRAAESEEQGSAHPSPRFEDRDVSQASLHEVAGRLEIALGRAQGGRETAWADLVRERLLGLQRCLQRHAERALGRQGLYAEIAGEAPHLGARSRQLERQLDRLATEAEDLLAEVERVRRADLQGVTAIRVDAERLLASLRDLMAKENDLMFERFRDLPALD